MTKWSDSGFRRAASDVLSSRRIPDILSIAATGLLSSRRIPDFLSIAASDILSSRRIPDILSINDNGAGMGLSSSCLREIYSVLTEYFTPLAL